MKCPKCGYLGFETTDRCRNCGYDFSLTPPASGAELPLRSSDTDLAMVDLALGDARVAVGGESEDLEVARPRLALDASPTGADRLTPPGRAAVPDARTAGRSADAAGELPLFAPRPAGPPLAVRRPGTEVPRARRTTTTRPARAEVPALPLVPEAPAGESPLRSFPRAAQRGGVAGVVGRLAASLIDIAILGSIDLVVIWLTMRIAGLGLTFDDLLLIRPLPMAAFFLVLAFLYLVGFTIGGGQTVGKMALGIRVIGEDDQGVDLTRAVVRALGALVSACTLGLLFVPVFFSADRRAVHDRLAGTRVVVG